ncbi:hypothetical protein B0H19DRAFT_1146821 [Mycena capillaripes]|nr:hypothetical protein B0H19DRAFT_1146821 [Mycena capillaripes]
MKLPWQPYLLFSEQIQVCPKLFIPPLPLTCYGRQPELSDAPQFLKQLDGLARVAGDIFRDFEELSHRAVATLGEGNPVLDDLYSSSVAFFEASSKTSRASHKYLSCCALFFDSTIKIPELRNCAPNAALDSFNHEVKELSTSIRRADACWQKIERVLKKELEGSCCVPDLLYRLEVAVFPWLPHAQRVGLRHDLPSITNQARAHLGTFGDRSKALQDLLKKIDLARSGAPNNDMTSDTARRTAGEAGCFVELLFLLHDYKMGLAATTGRTYTHTHNFEMY